MLYLVFSISICDYIHCLYIINLKLHSVCSISSCLAGGLVIAPSPSQGTILIDLPTDDPEYISVEEQVQYYQLVPTYISLAHE